MTTVLATIVVVAASAMLLRSGIAHARHPDRLRSALDQQGLWTPSIRPLLVIGLPVAEVAAGALGLGAAVGVVPTVGAAVVLGGSALAFALMIGVLLVRGSPAPCGCGSIDAPLHGTALLRPAILLAGAVVLARGADLAQRGPTEDVVLAALAGLSGAVLVDLVVVTASTPRAEAAR